MIMSYLNQIFNYLVMKNYLIVSMLISLLFINQDSQAQSKSYKKVNINCPYNGQFELLISNAEFYNPSNTTYWNGRGYIKGENLSIEIKSSLKPEISTVFGQLVTDRYLVLSLFKLNSSGYGENVVSRKYTTASGWNGGASTRFKTDIFSTNNLDIGDYYFILEFVTREYEYCGKNCRRFKCTFSTRVESTYFQIISPAVRTYYLLT